MTVATIPGLEHLYPEFFLGLVALNDGLRIRALFVLTTDHPAYAPPLPGEAHCYREGEIRMEGVRLKTWKPGRPSLLSDPDGSIDFGDIQLDRKDGRYRVDTEWFAMEVEADRVTAVLD